MGTWGLRPHAHHGKALAIPRTISRNIQSADQAFYQVQLANSGVYLGCHHTLVVLAKPWSQEVASCSERKLSLHRGCAFLVGSEKSLHAEHKSMKFCLQNKKSKYILSRHYGEIDESKLENPNGQSEGWKSSAEPHASEEFTQTGLQLGNQWTPVVEFYKTRQSVYKTTPEDHAPEIIKLLFPVF